MTSDLTPKEKRAEMDTWRMEKLRAVVLSQDMKAYPCNSWPPLDALGYPLIQAYSTMNFQQTPDAKEKRKKPQSGEQAGTPHVVKRAKLEVPVPKPKPKSLKMAKAKATTVPSASLEEITPTPKTKGKGKEVAEDNSLITPAETVHGSSKCKSIADLINLPWTTLRIKGDEELGHPRNRSMRKGEENAEEIYNCLQSFLDWCPAEELQQGSQLELWQLTNLMLYEAASFSSKVIKVWAMLQGKPMTSNSDIHQDCRATQEAFQQDADEKVRLAEQAQKKAAELQEECDRLRETYEGLQRKHDALSQKYSEDIDEVRKQSAQLARKDERTLMHRAILEGYPEEGEQIWNDVQHWSRYFRAVDLKADLLQAGYTKEEADEEVKAKFGE